MLFGPYFHEKTWSAASYCSLKVTKPPESFKIEAKYAKVCFLWQGLIPGLLRGSQVSQPLDHQSSDKNGARWKKDQFKFDILFEHFPYTFQPLIVRDFCYAFNLRNVGKSLNNLYLLFTGLLFIFHILHMYYQYVCSSFYYIHCVANVQAVWPVYNVKCLCSREWD